MTDDDTFRAGASIGAALALADVEAGLALRAGGWHGHLTDGLGALLSGAAVPHPAVAAVAGGCLALATGAVGAAALEGSARWAARRESAATGASSAVPASLLVTSPSTGRVVVGTRVDARPRPRVLAAADAERGRPSRTLRRRLVALRPEDSLIIIGSTGSGKTSGVAAPLIRDWGGQPAAVNSANTAVNCLSMMSSSACQPAPFK